VYVFVAVETRQPLAHAAAAAPHHKQPTAGEKLGIFYDVRDDAKGRLGPRNKAKRL